MRRGRASAGQPPRRQHLTPLGTLPSIEIDFRPCLENTQYKVSRVGGRADGYDRTTLAGGYLDVSLADCMGLSARAVVVLLASAIADPYAESCWRLGGLKGKPPQGRYDEPLPGLEWL